MRISKRFIILAALACSSAGTALAADRPPNVVLIVSDDHAWGDYSFMGHPQVRTPRIDRLATESRAFRRGYVASSLCSPSLATILTGLYPHQHKVTSNDPPLPPGKAGAAAKRDPAYLDGRRRLVGNFDEVPTLPRLLAAKGYRSFQAGKWWGGHYRHGGFTQGMSHGEPDRGGRHGDEGLVIGRQTMAPVTDFIDESTKAGAPFFVWYAPMMPHSPHNPPERLLAKYRDKTPSIHVARYWACVEWFDETVGQLLDHLDARGLAKDTLVVYLADNGWIQDPESERYAPRSKQSPYDGGLRTPILLRWPGKIAPGESDRLAQSIDLAPTILKASGVEAPAGLPGIDLRDDGALKARSTIFGEIFTHNAVDLADPASSLRFRWAIDDTWKLILPQRQNEPEARPELFDLAADPLETRDRSADHPEIVAKLSRAIREWWPARE